MGEAVANAKFIVKAANNYEKLADNLRCIADCYGVGSTNQQFLNNVRHFILEARETLAEINREDLNEKKSRTKIH